MRPELYTKWIGLRDNCFHGYWIESAFIHGKHSTHAQDGVATKTPRYYSWIQPQTSELSHFHIRGDFDMEFDLEIRFAVDVFPRNVQHVRLAFLGDSHHYQICAHVCV